MRNLKRALSLALASVMVLGLMIVGSSAKTSQFADAADINEDYKEAIDVLTTIGVLEGVDDGTNYDPQGTLTREMAAKVISVMLLGKDNADRLGNNTQIFKDVAAGRWSAGYIAYCYNAGIIAGDGAGNFDPEGKLTGVAFGKVLLTALGYKSEIEGYVNSPSWSINVASAMVESGIDVEGITLSDPITREQAAQMAINTIKTPLVEYDARTQVNVNGAEVVIGGNEAKYVTTTIANQQRISERKLTNTGSNLNQNGGYTVEFGEKYIKDLALENHVTDEFGRPNYTWTWKNEEIGTYLNKELLVAEYTTKVTGKMLYDLLGKKTIDEYGFSIYIDGETDENILGSAYFTKGNILRNNTEKVGNTGNGVLTQVFLDPDPDVEHVDIVIINTYLAQAEDDYSENKDEASFTIFGVEEKQYDGSRALVKNGASGNELSRTVKGVDFDIADVKEDDFYLVNVAENEIKLISDVSITKNVPINKFVKDTNVTSEGHTYYYSDSAYYADSVLNQYVNYNMKDVSYNLYFDQCGYLIGVDIVKKPDNYLFLTGLNTNDDNLSSTEGTGKVIFLDGTVATVKINMNKSLKADNTKFSGSALYNTWCAFTKTNDNVYTLTQIATSDAQLLTSDINAGQSHEISDTSGAAAVLAMVDKKHPTTSGFGSSSSTYRSVYGDENSIYITADVKKINAKNPSEGVNTAADVVIIDDVDSVSKGVQNVSLEVHNAKKVDSDISASMSDYTMISDGMYTLFDTDGFVIAAIVIGEDTGSGSKYVYVTSKNLKDGLNYEEFANGDYTWTRNVIIDGKIATLTEITDGTAPEIQNMRQNNWYEVRYNADGTVRKVTPIRLDDNDTTVDDNEFFVGTSAPIANSKSKWIGLIDYVEKSVETYETVLLFQNLTAQEHVVSVEGNTLQIDTNTTDKRGFTVSANANIVLVQDVGVYKNDTLTSTKLMQNIYEYDNGLNGLKKAVKGLNNNNKYKGYISAVFEGGVATSVIIYDKTSDILNAGTTTNNDGKLTIATFNYDTSTNKYKLTFNTGVALQSGNKYTITIADNNSDFEISYDGTIANAHAADSKGLPLSVSYDAIDPSGSYSVTLSITTDDNVTHTTTNTFFLK